MRFYCETGYYPNKDLVGLIIPSLEIALFWLHSPLMNPVSSLPGATFVDIDNIVFLQKPRGLCWNSPIGVCQKSLSVFLFTTDTPSTVEYAGSLGPKWVLLIPVWICCRALFCSRPLSHPLTGIPCWKVFPSETYAISKIWNSLSSAVLLCPQEELQEHILHLWGYALEILKPSGF